jgi:hypothetical protein
MPFIKYSLINTITGQKGIQGYVDANEIASFNEYHVPDEGIQGWHRYTRGITLCYVTLKSGVMNYSDDNFDVLAARILEARGQKDLAESHRAAAELVKANRKSPLSVS